MPETITCIGYLRVSTERQADEVHTSLADQEAAVCALAGKLETSVGRWFRDEGASGATVAGRPAFQTMLSWCAAHARSQKAPGYVLILNDSRFGRFHDPEEAGYWRHHLQRLGWVVRFAEGDDVQGDFRTVIRAIGSAQASEYRRNLVANTRRGMAGAASQGYWTREAPFGYRRKVVHPAAAERVLDTGKRKVDGEKVKLTPHPDEAPVVRWVFEAYVGGGESLQALADKLTGRVPGRQWSRTVVGAMLRNPAYRGDVVGGRRRDGETTLYGCEDAHPAIVDPDLWHRAQARLEENANQGPAVQTDYLMTGLLHCAECGEPYTGGGGGRGGSPMGTRRRFYRDRGGISKVCPGRIGTVMRHLVDDAVLDVLGTTLSKPSVRRRITQAVDEALVAASGAVGDTETALRAARARLEQRRDRLVDAVTDGIFEGDEAATKMDQIRAGLAEVEGKLQALRFRKGRARGAQSERDRLIGMAMDFPALAARMSGHHLRELVEMWLGSATFDKVTRMLTLGIRPVPAVASFQLLTSPGPVEREQVGLIVRSTSLIQPGHSYRVAEAAAAVRRARRA